MNKKHESLLYGKIYRWRCGKTNNSYNDCACDKERYNWKDYCVLGKALPSGMMRAVDNIYCGDFIVPLAKYGTVGIRVLTMNDNPVVGIMSSDDIKLFMVET